MHNRAHKKSRKVAHLSERCSLRCTTVRHLIKKCTVKASVCGICVQFFWHNKNHIAQGKINFYAKIIQKSSVQFFKEYQNNAKKGIKALWIKENSKLYKIKILYNFKYGKRVDMANFVLFLILSQRDTDIYDYNQVYRCLAISSNFDQYVFSKSSFKSDFLLFFSIPVFILALAHIFFLSCLSAAQMPLLLVFFEHAFNIQIQWLIYAFKHLCNVLMYRAFTDSKSWCCGSDGCIIFHYI